MSSSSSISNDAYVYSSTINSKAPLLLPELIAKVLSYTSNDVNNYTQYRGISKSWQQRIDRLNKQTFFHTLKTAIENLPSRLTSPVPKLEKQSLLYRRLVAIEIKFNHGREARAHLNTYYSLHCQICKHRSCQPTPSHQLPEVEKCLPELVETLCANHKYLDAFGAIEDHLPKGKQGEMHFKVIQRLLLLNRFSEVQFYLPLLKKTEYLEEAYTDLVVAYIKLKKWQEAEQFISKISQKPLIYKIVQALISEGLLDRAIKKLSLLKGTKNYEEASAELTIVFMKKRDWRNALAMRKKVTRSDLKDRLLVEMVDPIVRYLGVEKGIALVSLANTNSAQSTVLFEIISTLADCGEFDQAMNIFGYITDPTYEQKARKILCLCAFKLENNKLFANFKNGLTSANKTEIEQELVKNTQNLSYITIALDSLLKREHSLERTNFITGVILQCPQKDRESLLRKVVNVSTDLNKKNEVLGSLAVALFGDRDETNAVSLQVWLTSEIQKACVEIAKAKHKMASKQRKAASQILNVLLRQLSKEFKSSTLHQSLIKEVLELLGECGCYDEIVAYAVTVPDYVRDRIVARLTLFHMQKGRYDLASVTLSLIASVDTQVECLYHEM